VQPPERDTIGQWSSLLANGGGHGVEGLLHACMEEGWSASQPLAKVASAAKEAKEKPGGAVGAGAGS
jgi:hypothetical protein